MFTELPVTENVTSIPVAIRVRRILEIVVLVLIRDVRIVGIIDCKSYPVTTDPTE
jgi:hypothetical protein